jgi:hypothetical protein
MSEGQVKEGKPLFACLFLAFNPIIYLKKPPRMKRYRKKAGAVRPEEKKREGYPVLFFTILDESLISGEAFLPWVLRREPFLL